MKNASPGLIAYLAANTNLIFADLWTFTCKNGTVLRYTNWDTNLTVGGNTFACSDVLLENGKLKWTRGLEVNETDLTCYPNLGAQYGSPSTVGGLPFLQASKQGILDRATARRERLFMPTPGDVSLGTVLLFLGEVTDINPLTQNMAVLKCKDATNLLNIQMPRRQYQPTCPWTFGDSNCTVNRSSLTKTSSVASSTGTNINCALADAAGFYNYGVVAFTSGQNNGQSRAIKNWIPGTVTLTGPSPFAPAIGDTFTITPGCGKSLDGQIQQFNASVQPATTTPNVIVVGLTNAAGFFNNGMLLMTSGPCVGQSQTISSWSNGTAVLANSLSQPPNAGDECTLTSPASNTGNTCTGYNNIVNFGGQPFVPVPETAY